MDNIRRYLSYIEFEFEIYLRIFNKSTEIV